MAVTKITAHCTDSIYAPSDSVPVPVDLAVFQKGQAPLLEVSVNNSYHLFYHR